MRLWHPELIDVLPRQQLLGQWRELNSIFKLQNKHVLINFVYNYPKDHLFNYSIMEVKEMKRRGYNYNLNNLMAYFSNLSPNINNNPFPQKMTERYLLQCYYNLQEKFDCGSITEKEWQLIKPKCFSLLNETKEKIKTTLSETEFNKNYDQITDKILLDIL